MRPHVTCPLPILLQSHWPPPCLSTHSALHTTPFWPRLFPLPGMPFLAFCISAHNPSSLTITLVSILKKRVGRMKGKGLRSDFCACQDVTKHRPSSQGGTATQEHGTIPSRDSDMPLTDEGCRRSQARNQHLSLGSLKFPKAKDFTASDKHMWGLPS